MKSIDVEGGFYFVEGEIFQIIIYTTIGIHRCTFDVGIVSITTKYIVQKTEQTYQILEPSPQGLISSLL